jgi:hypothetical protein
MPKQNFDWYPITNIFYWLFILLWIGFILSFFSVPSGMLGGLAAAILNQLTPKYVTIFMNTFAFVGAYIVTRLLLIFRISWKTTRSEVCAVLCVVWISLTGIAIWGARCDIYIFCADDAPSSKSDCETDWDRQGANCR